MPDEIIVKYKYAPDYRKIPATGAWGGLSPNAEVVINFFVEFLSPPESVKIQINETGNIEPEKTVHVPVEITRELLIGVVMRPDIARAVGDFLIGYANKADEITTPKEKSEP